MITTQMARAPKPSLKERYKAAWNEKLVAQRVELANGMAGLNDQDLAELIDLLIPEKRIEIATAFENSASKHFPAKSAQAQTFTTLAELLRAA